MLLFLHVVNHLQEPPLRPLCPSFFWTVPVSAMIQSFFVLFWRRPWNAFGLPLAVLNVAFVAAAVVVSVSTETAMPLPLLLLLQYFTSNIHRITKVLGDHMLSDSYRD